MESVNIMENSGLSGNRIFRILGLEGMRNFKTPEVGTTFMGQSVLGKLVKMCSKTAW